MREQADAEVQQARLDPWWLEDQERDRAAKALCRQQTKERQRKAEMVSKLAAERGLSFQDAIRVWFQEQEEIDPVTEVRIAL